MQCEPGEFYSGKNYTEPAFPTEYISIPLSLFIIINSPFLILSPFLIKRLKTNLRYVDFKSIAQAKYFDDCFKTILLVKNR